MKYKLPTQLFFLLMLSFSKLLGQGENDNWIFGNGSYLSFQNGNPAIKPGVETLRTWEGCTSVSSKDGALLFYSDGSTIWNYQHLIMENGSGLLGDPSSTSSCVVVPFPGHPGQYFVFCVDANIGQHRQVLSYNIVDMKKNNGQGSVIVKNLILFAGADEKIAVTRHCNARDFWIVAHLAKSEVYKAYLLNSRGLSTAPVESKTPSSFSSITEIGYLKFSPDGNYLVNALGHQQVLEICQFNKTNGKLTLYCADKQFYKYGQSYYGIAFSANGRMLYASILDAGEVYQYDLGIPPDSLFSKRKLVMEAPNRLGALQLARDNKIYISNGYNSLYLNCITEPEKAGTQCQPRYKYLKFKTGTQLGLPTYVESLDKYFSLGKDSVIDLDEYTLTANVYNARYLWSSGASTQSITIDRSGEYWVKIYDTRNCVMITDTIYIKLLRKKNFITNSELDTIEICGGDSIHLPEFTFSRSGIQLLWKNPGHLSGLADSGSGKPGPFRVSNPDTLTNAELNFTPYDGLTAGNDFRILIRVHPRPVIEAPARISLCGGQKMNISHIQFKPANSRISWKNDNTATGISDSGILSDLSSQKLSRNTFDTVSQIILTGKLGACVALPVSLDIENKAIPWIKQPEIRELCPGESSPPLIFSSALPATVINWKNTSGIGFLPDSGQNKVPGIYATAASYTRILTVLASPVRRACKGGSVLLKYMLYGKPKAAFTFDSAFFTGSAYQARLRFTNLSSDTVYSRWDFSDGTSEESTHSVHYASRNQVFGVQLIAGNEHGCEDTCSWQSPETPFVKYFIPNAFSPSSVNRNSTFLIFGSGNEHVHTRIYSRWGELLFETFTNEAWNGTYQGTDCPEAVYLYETVIQNAGNELYRFKGTLTLLR